MKEPEQDKPDQPARKYERPLSLAPMSFLEAVRKVAKAKPPGRKPKPKTKPA
jgi:hypothetical protein